MVNKTLNQYLAGLIAVAVVLANSAISQGEVISNKEQGTSEQVTSAQGTSAQVTNEESFMLRLDQELSLSKTDYHQVLNRIGDTQNRIKLVEEEQVTLAEQVENLRLQEEAAKGRLVVVLQEMVATENEVKELTAEIEVMEKALREQKEALREYVRLIYTQEQELFTVGGSGELDGLKLLFADDSVSDNLAELNSLELLNETGQMLLSRLNELADGLMMRQEQLKGEKEALNGLRADLSAEKAQLTAAKEAKERLLVLTEGQEKVYSDLLAQTQKQQEQVVAEISHLNEVRVQAEKAIAEGSFDYEAFTKKLSEESKAVFDFQVSNLGKSVAGFSWPVAPKRGISAYFRNSGDGYKSSFGVVHNAIDIPTLQGSAIYAPAEAVVYSVKDNGYGYSYIILSHAGGFTTTYGHVSKIMVKAGQYVPQGTIIGLSGGMPGTLGAGYMTTGPHLHFEMRLNGVYVDPMDYLPLDVLDEGSVIEKYKEKVKMAKEIKR